MRKNCTCGTTSAAFFFSPFFFSPFFFFFFFFEIFLAGEIKLIAWHYCSTPLIIRNQGKSTSSIDIDSNLGKWGKIDMVNGGFGKAERASRCMTYADDMFIPSGRHAS